MMTTEERLLQAINEHAIIDIIYHGGSQPGTARQISPASIKDNKVRAYCHTSKAMKLFVIDKISIIENPIPDLAIWQPEPPQRYTSIEEFLNDHKGDLLHQGWHIEKDPEYLSLHRSFKNGKPMKGADVALEFDEFTSDLVMNEIGEVYEDNIRKKKRPWAVWAKGRSGRTYGNLDAALVLFMEWAKMLAPNQKEL